MTNKIVKTWTTKSGLAAAIVLVRDGSHHCGYVEAPAKLAGVDYNDVSDINVHGGITYSGEAWFLDVETKPYVFGYDCAHAGDEMRGEMAKYMGTVAGDVWRDEAYCEEQCELLAEQLAAYVLKLESK